MNSKSNLLEAYDAGYRIIEGEIHNPKGKMLQGVIIKGYKAFTFKKYSKVFAHRLVAYQKYGDKIFNNDVEVRHLDGNTLNNLDDNISIGDKSRNMMDVPKEKRIARAKHAASFLKKYNYEKIKKFYKQNRSYKKTMEKFGIKSKGALHYILKN